MIPNPTFINCINNIKNGQIVLEKLNIIYDKPINFKTHDSVFYYEPDVKKFDYVAAFDLDWTLTYNEKHLFPSDIDDIKISDSNICIKSITGLGKYSFFNVYLLSNILLYLSYLSSEIFFKLLYNIL
jgi:hypothetical protein